MSMRHRVGPTWRGVPLDVIIKKLGIAANLRQSLDAGDNNSYATGQTWADRSGVAVPADMFRGADGSATSTDPTFNGTAGERTASNYWSFDGGDYFTHSEAIQAWMTSMHQDNAAWSYAGWWYFASITTVQILMATLGGGTAGTSTGITIQTTAAGQLLIFHGNAASTDTTITSTATLPATGVWVFVAVALNEATGASGGTFQINATQEAFTSTYAAPAAGAASGNLQFGARGAAVGPVANGTRLGMSAMWDRRLTNNELNALYHVTRHRYGV